MSEKCGGTCKVESWSSIRLPTYSAYR